MKTKPTILVVENAVDITGSLLSILRSSELLREHFSFEFILPAEGTASSVLRARRFQVWIVPMKELRMNVISVLLYIPILFVNAARYFSVQRRTGAVLVVNNDFYNLIPALATILGSQTPYVCYVRFRPSKFPRILSRLWFGLHNRFSRKIISVSEAVRRELPISYKNVVVHNELPEHEVEFRSASASTILFPANYINGKGQDLALEAFACIAKSHSAWTLRFVGGDMGLAKNKAFKESLIRRTQELGLTENILFFDFSQNLVEHYLDAAFVLNFSESESFSLTTLEAQYYGRPVIVTRCGGPEEIVVEGDTGVLVPLRDVAAMAKAMEFLITHPEKRISMGKRAYDHVREKFSYERTIGKLVDVYRDAIEDRNAHAF